MTWTSSPTAAVTFSRFCAPTALAGLMDCTPLEAAEALLAVPGLCHPKKGFVKTPRWNEYLESLGLVRVSTERPLYERLELVDQARAKGGWEEGERLRFVGRQWYRRQWAPDVNDNVIRYPTVGQWLRANPNVTAVVGVKGHTLYIEDGQVSADTKSTKSLRCRIQEAFVLEPTE